LLDSVPWNTIDKELVTAETMHAHRLNIALLVAVERAYVRQRGAEQLPA
jgi:hypothetical protein